MDILSEMKNPSSAYRIKPFWFWNGDMKEEEIAYQLKEMINKGIGGVFICARQGIQVPYLSKEWFSKVKYACDTAKMLGLETWLYDEYPYPSGMSGGEVLLKHPEAEHMVLRHASFVCQGENEIEKQLGWAEVLFVKAIRLDETGKKCWNDTIDLMDEIGLLQVEKLYQTTGLTKYNQKRFFSYNPKLILRTMLPAGDWQIEVFMQERMGEFKYYGAFFDPCDAEAVKTFLQTTHERYKKQLGGLIGKDIKGIFTDEVGLLSPIPWSKHIPAEFRKDKGYDLIAHMPAIYCKDYPRAYQIRYDLYDTAHKLFTENFHKQVARWCGEHGMEWVTEVPSMRMSTQKYSSIPGGDTAHEKLGKSLEWIYDEYIRNYRSNARAVSSLAKQLDRQFAMIESFHSVGWTMTIQDAKWMIDRLAASGINLYNFHAFYYTIDSINKHDAPPSQFLQNPYWKHYQLLSDYAARLGAWITRTEEEVKVAVLDPVASLWALTADPFHGFPYRGEDEKEGQLCNQIREDWVHICKQLLFRQIAYDHLDTEILMKAEIEHGKIKIGRAAYEIIVMPPAVCWEDTVYRKIKDFIESGGKVISLGKIPKNVIGTDEFAAEIFESSLMSFEMCYYQKFTGSLRAESGNRWIACCDKWLNLPVRIQISEEDGRQLVSAVRKDEEGLQYVFLGNQGKEKIKAIIDSYNVSHTIYRYNIEKGLLEEKALAGNNIELGAYESGLFLLRQSTGKQSTDTEKKRTQLIIDSNQPANVLLEGKNIYRMENFYMSVNKQSWKNIQVKPFIEQAAESKILEKEHFSYYSDFGIPKSVAVEYPITVWYRTDFYIEKIPEDIMLLLDNRAIGGIHNISINGEIITDGYQKVFVNDQNNKMYPIVSSLKKGRNELKIEVRVVRPEEGLRDPIFLYGTFGVELKKGITSAPKKAVFSEHYVEGFPYYSGTTIFERKFTLEPKEVTSDFDLKFDFGDNRHDCIEVEVNGNTLGVRGFSPYVWKGKKEYLLPGENGIVWKVTNTLANMLDGTYFDYEKHEIIRLQEGK